MPARPRSARPRLRSALVAAALLATATPLVAQAMAPALTCGVRQSGRWERIPVDAFQSVNGIQASQNDAVTAYTVDETRPQDLAVTNGSTVLLTHSNGCAWTKSLDLSATPSGSQPFSGATASIVSVALLGDRVVAAAQEGSGSASRPHILTSPSGRPGTWAASDNGLPPQGAPRLLRATGDGRTAYLTVSPTASGGSDAGSTTGILPGLPGAGGSATPTGFLYRTTDGGASWTLQTGAADLPGGGTGFSQLDVDPQDSNRLYGIVSGRLVMSSDGGGSFRTAPGTGFSAVTAMGPLQLAAFTSSGQGFFSNNGGASLSPFPAPQGVTSAAFRSGESSVVVESSGVLRQVEPANGSATAIPAAVPARTGSLLGDRGAQSSVHALAGHALLRYVDPLPKGVTFPPLAVGDLTVPPPNPGVVTPAVRSLSLPVGTSALEDFTLHLPKNPTPLDLFFLVDVSTSMQDYIDNLKTNIHRIVHSLTAAKVDLKVGLGILGTGPARGEQPYPAAYVYPPIADKDHPGQTRPDPRTYVRPVLYKRLRAVGDVDAQLTAAVNQLKLETTPDGTTSYATSAGQPANNHEGQLIALRNLATGEGTQTEQEWTAHLPSKSAVPPGQEAGFRSNPDVRKLVIMATNENFDEPFGTDHYPDSDPVHGNPHLDFGPTLKILNDRHIQVIGLTTGVDLAAPDLQTVAGGTHTYAPPGGVFCGGDPPVTLRAGAPLVCNSGDGFSDVIIRVLASLVDRQDVRLVPHNRSPVLGALDGRSLLGLDVKHPSQSSFSVRVSCVDVQPGAYRQDVDAILRQTVVGRARLNVTCVKAATLVRPKPITPGGNPPPPPAQPVNVVAPPVPPPPAAQPQIQPQVQPQVQVQVQPLTAAAIQEQQELQLALALNGTLKQDDPAFEAGQQLAMVDRRRREEVQALGVLAFAVTACAGLGLARLRSRPEVSVRRVR